MTAEPGFPHSLVELGSCLPKDGIEAALRWEPVGKTYFFKGDQYWRFNEEKRTADPGYPKPITVWKGVPVAPQGAFISREGCECSCYLTKLVASAQTSRVFASWRRRVGRKRLEVQVMAALKLFVQVTWSQCKGRNQSVTFLFPRLCPKC